MYNNVIYLMSETYAKDPMTGIMSTTKTSRKVFGEIESVGRSEFATAGAQGLKPEFRITMPSSSYQGEKICSINDVNYAIYRTFTKYGEIELYVERQTGVTNG